MASLFEYFKVDFANSLGQTSELETSDPNIKIRINSNVGVETYSNAKFVAYYIPECADPLSVCFGLIVHTPNVISESNNIITYGSFPGENNLGLTGSDNSVFANRIYLYSERELSEEDLKKLEDFASTNRLNVTVRSKGYVVSKISLERPLAFISHDSRDKTDIAYPIAIGLTKLMCPVWYDEFSLKVGDHLRESIEKGLKETKKCILVLSPNFFSNTGWTKTEFNSIFTREILEKSSVVLPVWFNISTKDVYDYSPSLADRVGLDWSKLGSDEIIRRLYNAVKTS